MNFLVIRFSSLGDIVQTTAFIKKLKDLYPSSNIIYATKEEFGSVLKSQSYINRVVMLRKGEPVIDFAKRIGYVHCIFDLHSNFRSILLSRILNPACVKRVNKNTFYRYLVLFKVNRLFGFNSRKTRDNIEDQLKLLGEKYSKEDIKPYLETFSDHFRAFSVDSWSNVIGFAPGAKWKTKMWPKEYYKRLAEILVKDGFRIHIFGSKDESEIAEFIKSGFGDNVKSFCGKLSLNETLEVMSRCRAFVCNDSGLMHVAVALDIPTVAIFGPTVREFGFSPRGNSVVLERDLFCRPCSLHGSDKCPRRTFECMKSIKPDDVYSVLMKWLG